MLGCGAGCSSRGWCGGRPKKLLVDLVFANKSSLELDPRVQRRGVHKGCEREKDRRCLAGLVR